MCRFSPGCRGRPPALAICWCPCGCEACFRCCPSRPSSPPRCCGHKKRWEGVTPHHSKTESGGFCFSRQTGHEPVAEVVLEVPGDQWHGELVGAIGVEDVELLGGRRRHLEGGRTWRQRACERQTRKSSTERSMNITAEMEALPQHTSRGPVPSDGPDSDVSEVSYVQRPVRGDH